MTNCSHQFIHMDSVSKPENHMTENKGSTAPYSPAYRSIFGVKVACALCGEIRHLWPDGKVDIVIEGAGYEITIKDDRKQP